MNDNTGLPEELSEEDKERLKRLMIEAGWDNLGEEELTERVSETLRSLVESGQVEQLIGEDGEFYYRKAKGG